MLNGNRPLASEYKHRRTAEAKLKRMNDYARSTGKGNCYRLQGFLRVDGTRRVWWDIGEPTP